ncbi:carbohydrate kinase family protein [Lysinibacillus halotolerans]|uniref:Carbohydrate kinase n=1 Tax=Lysinibacillus halotolerans TaxID=1368476 RepID=A0A3M8HA38_9BACI|nr:carbohydrate kinase [Lysinibacillus halotolerans]RNC98960.1 carbohydrate kinase [Lysinibacillus halotolerans]
MNQPILCIGELLIDFFSNEVNTTLVETQTFTKKAGGAPANVCVAIAKLGGEAFFCGKVGDDPFGEFLSETLVRENVHTDLLVKDPSHSTTLAFVSLQKDGQRDFVFNRGADAYLTTEDVPNKFFKEMNIVHFGSATALLPGQLQETYKKILVDSKENNSYISFDPNFRSDLWSGQEKQFIQLANEFISNCDFLKVSDEELYLLTNEQEIAKAVTVLHQFGAKSIAVTLGKEGTYFSYNGKSTTIPSIPVQAIDTTGAGDAFVGAVLYQLGKVNNPHNLTFDEWHTIISFANKVGAKVCEKVSAIEALPTLDELEKF